MKSSFTDKIEDMAPSPLQIFNSIHARAEKFINTGAGPKAKDDLRAALVFNVAAIDAYFSVKIIDYLKKERTKKSFKLSSYAQKLVKDAISNRDFGGKDFKNLTPSQQDMVNTYINSNKPATIAYLEKAIILESFQTVKKISSAFEMMGKTPSETWRKVAASMQVIKLIKKKKRGPRKKNKGGRKANLQKQLTSLFDKRHLIAHEGDVTLRGKRRVGDERLINSKQVKSWLGISKKFIKETDKLIK